MLIIWILIIIIALIWGFSYGLPVEEESISDLDRKIWGDSVAKPCYMKYVGGIKGLSVNQKLNEYVVFLNDGIGVGYMDNKKKIPYKCITDVAIENTKSIEQRVSMGKLLFFGILAFGMKKNQEDIIKEFIVIDVEDEEDGKYSVVFDLPIQSKVQEVYNYIHRNIKKSKTEF